MPPLPPSPCAPQRVGTPSPLPPAQTGVDQPGAIGDFKPIKWFLGASQKPAAQEGALTWQWKDRRDVRVAAQQQSRSGDKGKGE